MGNRYVLIGLVAVFVLAVGASSAGTAGSAALAQTPGQGQPRLGAAPPGTHGVPGDPPGLRPEQIEKRISPEEREKLGLPELTRVKQYGKVHPDVRAVLQTGQMPWVKFKGWEPIGFVGTAYVAVYLRVDGHGGGTSPDNEEAIRQIQSRVLSRLTAAEFGTVHLFRRTPGILGYVNAEGVTELQKDADVLAVGLDDRPVPEPPVGAPAEPPPRGVAQGPTERRGNVELPVYEALGKSTDAYVEVGVLLRYVPSGPALSPEAIRAQSRAEREVQDRVLSSLTAEEFRLKARDGSSIDGYVNSAGLAKLARHPDVTGVGVAGLWGRIPAMTGKRR